MDKKALLELAAHIEKVPEVGFDMLDWTRVVDGHVLEPEHYEKGFMCGMAACLGGHAAICHPDRLYLRKCEDNANNGLLVSARDTSESGTRAFAEAYDLCDCCAEELTSCYANHITPTLAAAALRAVANGESLGPYGRSPYPEECQFGAYDCKRTR